MAQTFACAPRALSPFPFASLCRNPPPWTTVANWTPKRSERPKKALCLVVPLECLALCVACFGSACFPLLKNPVRSSSRDSRSMSCHLELSPLRPCLMRLLAAAESVLARLFAISCELCRNFVPAPIWHPVTGNLPRGKLIHGGQFLGRRPGKHQYQLA